MSGQESFRTPETDSSGSCVNCSRPAKYDNFVQCDQCDDWWHMRCAGVTDSIADRPWSCRKCLPLSVYSKSTNKSARIALKLQRLEEERAIQQRALEAEKRVIDLSIQLDKNMLEEKYTLLEEQLEEDEDNGSRRSRTSQRGNIQRVKEWMKQLPTNEGSGEEAAGGNPLPAGTENQRVEGNKLPLGNAAVFDTPKKSEFTKPSAESWPVVKPHLPTGSQAVINPPKQSGRMDGQHNPAQMRSSTTDLLQLQGNQQRYTGAIPKTAPKLPVNDCKSTVGKLVPPVPPVQPPGKPLFCPTLNQSRPDLPSYSSYQELLVKLRSMNPMPDDRNSAKFIGAEPILQGQPTSTVPFHTPLVRNQFESVPRTNNCRHPTDIQPNTFQNPPASRVPESGPSPSQIAARQVMARDLPQFSGNPEDWPIFISSFNNTTLACGYNSAENLARLQRCLKGHAYESVKSRLLLPESVPQVIDTLRLLYGRPELLISALLQKTRSVAAPKADKLETIIDFGLAVRTLCDHLEAAGLPEHLSNPMLLMELVEKLPPHIKMQWAEHMQQHAVVDLKTFGDFMHGVVTAVSRVTTYVGGSSSGQQKQWQKGAVNTHTSEERAESDCESASPKDRLCVCCKRSGHRLAECTAFKSYSVDDRWKFAQSNGLCRSCLNAHGRRSCRYSAQCVIEGCQYRHHPLLHSNRSSGQPTPTMSTVQNHIHRQHDQGLLFRIVPVIISGPRASIETFAFLDDGSDLSLVESSLVDQLGIDGLAKPLCLKWTGNVTRVEQESKQVKVLIRGMNSPKQFFLNDVRTVKEITLPEQSLDYEDLAERHRYLQGLPIVSYEKAVPRLLIGVNVNLTIPLQVKEGKKGEPIAVKTRLGWSIFGGSGKRTTHTLNFHTCEFSYNEERHKTVKEFPEEEWPKQANHLQHSEEELRPCFMVQGSTIPAAIVYFSRLSKWHRLLCAVAYVHRFVNNCRRRGKGDEMTSYLSQDELKKAKNKVMRMVQYPDEMESLSKGDTEVDHTSVLYQLVPILDEHEVIRVGRRTGNRKLDDEGLETLKVEDEGIVNNRPLTYLSLYAEEGEALPANHFLLGSSSGVRQLTIAFTNPASVVRNSYNQIQHQLDNVWKRWIREYLPVLTRRMKWFGNVKPEAEGDQVLIDNDNHRNGWHRGRFKEVVTAKDGIVRQAAVHSARGILRRPVSKLTVLDVGSESKTGTGGQCYGGENVAAGHTAPAVSPQLNVGANCQPVVIGLFARRDLLSQSTDTGGTESEAERATAATSL